MRDIYFSDFSVFGEDFHVTVKEGDDIRTIEIEREKHFSNSTIYEVDKGGVHHKLPFIEHNPIQDDVIEAVNAAIKTYVEDELQSDLLQEKIDRAANAAADSWNEEMGDITVEDFK